MSRNSHFKDALGHFICLFNISFKQLFQKTLNNSDLLKLGNAVDYGDNLRNSGRVLYGNVGVETVY